MPWLRLTIELVTPCFLAGSAGKSATPDDLRDEGLRPASLIGVWRFWLRALRGPGRDAVLFGTQEGRGRQGVVAVRSPSAPRANVIEVNKSPDDLTGRVRYPQYVDRPAPPIDPLNYLLGMGLFKPGEGTQRPAFAAGQTFVVEVNVRRGADGAAWRDLRQTLWLWQSFGGLGARTRRGWGSVEIVKVENDAVITDEQERAAWRDWFVRPANETAIRQRLASLCPQMNVATARLGFTAGGLDPRHPSAPTGAQQAGFSSLEACCVTIGVEAFSTWPEALAELGLTFLRVRSNASRSNRPAGELRVQDHDAVHALLTSHTTPAHAPYRAAFGLPHNYFFKNLQRQNKAEFEGNVRGEARRASPLLVRVVRVGQEYRPLGLWFKAPLTRDGRVKEKKTNTSNLPAPDWSAVVRWLGALHAGGTGPAARPTAGGVGPTPAAKVAQEITSKPKPLMRGETRVGELRHNVFWVAYFPDANMQGRINNPADVPAGTANGTRAEFVIEQVASHGAFVRVVKVVSE